MPNWMPTPNIPVPDHAVPIWFQDGCLYIGLDGTSVKLPDMFKTLRYNGMERNALAVALTQCLQARAAGVETIGYDSHPTQAQCLPKAIIDQWKLDDKAKKAAAKAAEEARVQAIMAEFWSKGASAAAEPAQTPSSI